MKKNLLKLLVGFAVAIGIMALTVQIKFTLDQGRKYESAPFSIEQSMASADVALGKRLYSVRNGCIDCHGADLSGVQIMDDPAMGSIHGANITPFMLSQWKDQEIARAIRYGIHKSGHSLQFMPSFDFQGLSLGDIASLVAYLRSVPPVEKSNHLNTFGPDAKFLSFINQMPVMFPAKILDLNKGFGEKPTEAPTREFGQYLANSCIGCHGAEFRGGKIPGGDPAWPAAQNIRLGANPIWTEILFQQTIRTGISPTLKQKLRTPMPINLLAQMNDIEIKALWEFLSSLK